MITIIENGNIFDSKMQTIVNPINTVGVAGKGLALQFKQKFPEYYKGYRECCQKKKLRTGQVYLHTKTMPWILSFPTKEHWMNSSKLEFIEFGLDDFVKKYINWHIISIAFPALGCQNGGLQWDDVFPIMQEKLDKLSIPIEIYAPLGR